MKFTLFYLIFLLFGLKSYSQITDYPLEVKVPSFVDTSKNVIEHYGDANLDKLYNVLTDFITNGTGSYNIVHFGGSHIQAAIYTEQFKKRLNENFYDIVRSVGYVFPFEIAQTNHPVFYKSNYSGTWEFCKNVKKKQECVLGMGGISATTTDSFATIEIYPRLNNKIFSFDKVTVLYDVNKRAKYKVIINGKEKKLDSLGMLKLRFDTLQDTLKFILIRDDSFSGFFRLYGFILDKDSEGIMYSTIGINGAATFSFLKCERFAMELKEINPDLVILSLGTNDGYGKGYSDSVYYSNLDSLIKIVKSANNNCQILITVPNDDYYKRRYPNKNTAKQEKTIIKLAKDRNVLVWNLYRIMGGFGSSKIWYSLGLMKYDKIHFTPTGYRLKGDLFFSAFMKGYDKYLQKSVNFTFNGKF